MADRLKIVVEKRDGIVPLLPSSPDDIWILCFNVTRCTRTVQFLVCTGGVFIFYLLYGYMQELMFRLPGFRPFGWYLTLIQFGFYVAFSWLEMKVHWAHVTRKIPMRTYMSLAFYTVVTMGLSNAAVGYLNYPTQVIFKCCKLIPVLIGGILIQGKKFSFLDFLAACLMSVGLIIFTLADSQVVPNFDLTGYGMIITALVADAIIGNVQEKAMKGHNASNIEVVYFSYALGFIYILIGLVASGQLFEAFWFCWQYPYETYGYAVVFSITGYLGINIVLTLVKQFGAFVAVSVTTCRKAVTIVLSFLFFAKPFTFQYVWSGAIVVLGIYLNVMGKNRHLLKGLWTKLIPKWILPRSPVHKAALTV